MKNSISLSLDELGTKRWYKKGKLHREDGPAVVYVDGSTEWYKKGKLHREDGPAVDYMNGSQEWYLKGKLHREDGPAVRYPNGSTEWWIDGVIQKDRTEVSNHSSAPSIVEIFDKLKDHCVPIGNAYFEWTAKKTGFGKMSFYVNESGQIVCSNELMSKEFIKRMMCQMVDDCYLEDT